MGLTTTKLPLPPPQWLHRLVRSSSHSFLPQSLNPVPANVTGQSYEDPTPEPTEADLVKALVNPDGQCTPYVLTTSPLTCHLDHHLNQKEKLLKFVFHDNGDEDYTLTAFGVVQKFFLEQALNAFADGPASFQEHQATSSLPMPEPDAVHLSSSTPSSHNENNATQTKPREESGIEAIYSQSPLPRDLDGDAVAPPNAFDGGGEEPNPTNGFPSLTHQQLLEDGAVPPPPLPEDNMSEVATLQNVENAEHNPLDTPLDETFRVYGPAKYFSQGAHKTLEWLANQWVTITKTEFNALPPFELLYMYSEKTKRPAEQSGFLAFRNAHLKEQKKAGLPVGDGTRGGNSKLAAKAYQQMKEALASAASTPVESAAGPSTATAKKRKVRTYAPLTPPKVAKIKEALVLAWAALEQEHNPHVKEFLQKVYTNASRKLGEDLKRAQREAEGKARKKAQGTAAAAGAVAPGGEEPKPEDGVLRGSQLVSMVKTGTKKRASRMGKDTTGAAGVQATSSVGDFGEKENQSGCPAGNSTALPVLGTLDTSQLTLTNDMPNSTFGQMLPYGNIPNVVGASVQPATGASSNRDVPYMNENVALTNTYPAATHARGPRCTNAAAGPSRRLQQAIAPSLSGSPSFLPCAVDNSAYPFTFSMPHNLPIDGSLAPSLAQYMNMPTSSPMVMGMGAPADFSFQFPVPGHPLPNEATSTQHPQATNASPSYLLQHNTTTTSPHPDFGADAQQLGSGIWDLELSGSSFDFTGAQT